MRALELDPKMQVAQRNLEIAYFNTGYYDTRVAELNGAAARAPGRPRRALGARPHATRCSARRPTPSPSSRELLRYHPNDIGALVQLGLAEKSERRPRAAR